MADSCQCMARATTILWGDWPPTNKNKWKKKISAPITNLGDVNFHMFQSGGV